MLRNDGFDSVCLSMCMFLPLNTACDQIGLNFANSIPMTTTFKDAFSSLVTITQYTLLAFKEQKSYPDILTSKNMLMS